MFNDVPFSAVEHKSTTMNVSVVVQESSSTTQQNVVVFEELVWLSDENGVLSLYKVKTIFF